MPLSVRFSDDPAAVLAESGAFLASDPVRNNLILTLLHARVARPEPCRYWIATRGGATAGIAHQSPLTAQATLTPMDPEVVSALVEAIADSRITLPGVNGEAATAARFAGQWTERNKCAATPYQGLRMYELPGFAETPNVRGQLRQAMPADRDLIVSWVEGFQDDTGEHGGSAQAIVDQRLPAGLFSVWDDGGPVSMAVRHQPVAGVVRISLVYTPHTQRNRGYAGACVAEFSRQILTAGSRCMLYTDLANPSSNSIYRRIGYRAVGECLRYRFD